MVFWKTMVILGFTLSVASGQDPTINVPQGRIVGIKVYMKNSVTPIEIFFGIPYAMPPTGRLRFSDSIKTFLRLQRSIQGGDGPFLLTECHPDAPNLVLMVPTSVKIAFFLTYGHQGQRVDGKLQPVLVILYSESWSYGGINLPCQELAAEGVVVVTVAYRLHLLSFFTLKSISARGNLALLDQYLALVWIRENIAAFGGDPSSITLAGHSTGANSVLHHILSPRPNGLFNRAIIMSPRNIWKLFDERSLVNSSAIEKISREAAKYLGCSNESDREILQCMRARPFSDITHLISDEVQLDDYLQPITDDFLPETEQYLPLSLSKMLSSTSHANIQLDLLIGSTNLDALNFMDNIKYRILMKQNPITVYKTATTEIIPDVLRILSLDRSDAIMTLTHAIEWEYWKSNLITESNEINKAVEYVAQMESSAKWSAGEAILAAKLVRRLSRLYVYRYSHPSYVDLTGQSNNFSGAAHGTDLIALLGDALMLQVARRPASKNEKRISSIFQEYVVNFIKFGRPENQNEWPRYVSNFPNVHEICFNSESSANCNKHSIEKDVTFWMQYLPQFTNSIFKTEQSDSEHLKISEGENRLRGGVLAMCGVSVALLALLFISAILLHRGRIRRVSISEDSTQL